MFNLKFRIKFNSMGSNTLLSIYYALEKNYLISEDKNV